MEYVDLGLPSGNLWAKHLLGMNSDIDVENALYFQWGSEKGYRKDEKFDFSLENCDYNKTEWNFSDNNVKLPTSEDFKELMDNTEHEVEVINGVKGMCFTSKKSNRNSLFIPFIGYRNGSNVSCVGVYVSLWSSSLNVQYPNYVVNLDIYSDGDVNINHSYRYLGYGVLGIKTNNKESSDFVTEKNMEAELKEMTLKERFWKNGNIFLMSTGEYRMVYEDKLMDAHGFIPEMYITDDMVNRDSTINERVVTVYAPNKNACYLQELLNPSDDRILWKISDNIMTIDEIEKKLGIKNLVIIKKNPF